MGQGTALAGLSRSGPCEVCTKRGAQRPEGADTDLQDHLLTWRVEQRTGGLCPTQAAERLDGHLPISISHRTLPFPWHTPAFNCRDTCFLH